MASAGEDLDSLDSSKQNSRGDRAGEKKSNDNKLRMENNNKMMGGGCDCVTLHRMDRSEIHK